MIRSESVFFDKMIKAGKEDELGGYRKILDPNFLFNAYLELDKRILNVFQVIKDLRYDVKNGRVADGTAPALSYDIDGFDTGRSPWRKYPNEQTLPKYLEALEEFGKLNQEMRELRNELMSRLENETIRKVYQVHINRIRTIPDCAAELSISILDYCDMLDLAGRDMYPIIKTAENCWQEDEVYKGYKLLNDLNTESCGPTATFEEFFKAACKKYGIE